MSLDLINVTLHFNWRYPLTFTRLDRESCNYPHKLLSIGQPVLRLARTNGRSLLQFTFDCSDHVYLPFAQYRCFCVRKTEKKETKQQIKWGIMCVGRTAMIRSTQLNHIHQPRPVRLLMDRMRQRKHSSKFFSIFVLILQNVKFQQMRHKTQLN